MRDDTVLVSTLLEILDVDDSACVRDDTVLVSTLLEILELVWLVVVGF